MKAVLLAYDGTEQSERALARAAEVAKAFGAAVHITSVAPMRGSAHGMGPYDPRDRRPSMSSSSRAHELAWRKMGSRQRSYLPTATLSKRSSRSRTRSTADLIVLGISGVRSSSVRSA